MMTKRSEPPEKAVDWAIDLAYDSPCQKSKRGAVLFKGDVPVDGAFNGPPTGYECLGNQDCQDTCGKRCMHAEERLLVRSDYRWDFSEHDMLHVKIVDDQLVPSGDPSCWQCSRTMVDVGLAGMWLYHKDGWKRYEVRDFHDCTMFVCGIPMV